jgi:hypothetical protein
LVWLFRCSQTTKLHLKERRYSWRQVYSVARVRFARYACRVRLSHLLVILCLSYLCQQIVFISFFIMIYFSQSCFISLFQFLSSSDVHIFFFLSLFLSFGVNLFLQFIFLRCKTNLLRRMICAASSTRPARRGNPREW